MRLILSLKTDVNPIRGTSSRVISNYFECFYLIVARFPTNRRPWCHDVMGFLCVMCHDVMHTAPIIVTRSNIEPVFVTWNKYRGLSNKIQSHLITLSFMNSNIIHRRQLSQHSTMVKQLFVVSQFDKIENISFDELCLSSKIKQGQSKADHNLNMVTQSVTLE